MNLLPERRARLDSIFGDVYTCRHLSDLVLDADVTYTKNYWGMVEQARIYHTIAERFKFANVTPNGMMMPKKENVEYFTGFARCFFAMLCELQIFDKFAAWNVPAIRYKGESFTSEQAARPRASEYAHSDSWLGWDQSAIVFMIPLFGDVLNNGVRFFEHELDETWIKTLPSFTCPEAVGMLSRSRQLPYNYRLGHIYPNDIGTIHQTQRSIEAAGWRVSAEVVGYLADPAPDSFAAHTAFTDAVAAGILGWNFEFKANLRMGEIGAYDEQGRAIDVTVGEREDIPNQP